jgi:hypothetical protein
MDRDGRDRDPWDRDQIVKKATRDASPFFLFLHRDACRANREGVFERMRDELTSKMLPNE